MPKGPELGEHMEKLREGQCAHNMLREREDSVRWDSRVGKGNILKDSLELYL